MEQIQIELFSEIIPKKFKNVRYKREELFWNNSIRTKKSDIKGIKHTLEIFEVFDSNFEFHPLHKIYFIESFFDKKVFEFKMDCYKFSYVFELLSNTKDLIRSQIPIMNIHDFMRNCEIFDINLNFKRIDIEPKRQNLIDNTLSISNQVIRIDAIPQIFLSHVNKTASIKNVSNIKFEKVFYKSLLDSINQHGKSLNHVRDNLHFYGLSDLELESINNLLLKLQNRLDIDSDIPNYQKH